MGLFVETDENISSDDIRTSGSFEALPTGDYEVTVKDAKVQPYSKKPEWAGKQALNVQLRVIDGAPVGKGRVFFFNVPLFQSHPKFKTEKNPSGAARTYFDFFNAIGVAKENVDAGNLPDIRDFLGKRLSAHLIVKPADQWHDADYNEVRWVNESKGAPAGTAIAQDDPWAPSAPADDPWASSEITIPQGAPTF